MSEITKSFVDALDKVKAASKSKRGHNYKYAELSEVLDVLREAFDGTGLGVSQIPKFEEGKIGVETVLHHAGGESLPLGSLLLPHEQLRGMSGYQSCGAAITYARRYALCSIFSIPTEDEDAAHQTPETRTTTQKVTTSTGEYVIGFGKAHKGKTLDQVGEKGAKGFLEFLRMNSNGKELTGPAAEFEKQMKKKGWD